MSNNMKCSGCGGANLHKGALSSTGKMYFRPSGAKFLNLKTANMEVTAHICMDCGSIGLYGDTQKAKELIESKK